MTSLSLQRKFISQALEGLSKGALCKDVELGRGSVPTVGCSNVSLVYACAGSFRSGLEAHSWEFIILSLRQTQPLNVMSTPRWEQAIRGYALLSSKPG